MESNSITLDENTIKARQDEIDKRIWTAQIARIDFDHNVDVVAVDLYNWYPKLNFSVWIRYQKSIYYIKFSQTKEHFDKLMDYASQSQKFLFSGKAQWNSTLKKKN